MLYMKRNADRKLRMKLSNTKLNNIFNFSGKSSFANLEDITALDDDIIHMNRLELGEITGN